MKKWISCLLLLILSITRTYATPQSAPTDTFWFVAMDQPTHNNANILSKAFEKLGHITPSFAILNGVKSDSESCNDELYLERKNLVDTTDIPVIISVSGNDWVNCRNSKGDSIAIERLIRLKEIFFDDLSSQDNNPIELTRQSLGSRFSNYPENAYWHLHSILFATVHMPSNNNHFMAAAGRNDEFEDRVIANRQWLDRLFRIASRNQYKGIVLISDGNPFSSPVKTGEDAEFRDGFYEIRQQLINLISHYPGRVLFIHGHQHTAGFSDINWKGRLGTLELYPQWIRIDINTHTKTLFSARPALRKIPRTLNRARREKKQID